jgi:acyl carrier protein
MKMTVETVTDRIRDYLAEHFPAARSRRLEPDESLLTNGILDSLGVLDVVAFLESEFKITVTDDDLLPENFESLGRLTAFVEDKQNGGSR